MLKTCALHMTFIIALMHLVAVGGINTFLSNVLVMIIKLYPLMFWETMIFMMWNKLKNLLLRRVPSKLPICLKILMMLLINMRFMIYLNIAIVSQLLIKMEYLCYVLVPGSTASTTVQK